MSDLAAALVGHDPPILIAHLSDLHLQAAGETYDTYFRDAWGEGHNDAARTAIAEIKSLPRAPDLIVLTGDAVERATPQEYDVAAEMLQFGDVPLLVIPGNHDRVPSPGYPRGAFRAAYASLASGGVPDHPDGETFSMSWRFRGWDFIAIDTSDPSAMPDDGRRAAATHFAADADTPAVLLTHSPLLPVGTWADTISFHDKPFVAELTKHDRIRLVLSGHVHTNRAWAYGPARHVTAPSLSFGIGCGAGYRLIGLDAHGVVFSATRFIEGARRDMYDMERVEQASRLEFDAPARFENHPLRNPHVWPHVWPRETAGG